METLFRTGRREKDGEDILRKNDRLYTDGFKDGLKAGKRNAIEKVLQHIHLTASLNNDSKLRTKLWEEVRAMQN